MSRFKASPLQRLYSDIRYYRHMLPDIIAGLAMIALVMLVTVLGSML